MVRAALALCAALAVAPLTAAQSSPPNLNTVRLSQLNVRNNYNDVWGYTAPDGREYACMGAAAGFSIINCTDPLAPYEVAWFPGTFCTWRDLKTYNEFLYVVNDCSGGVDVVDMTDPENPVFVNTFGANHMNHAHNVAIDTDAGILYCTGTQNGMHVYDLDIDPVDPPRIELWGPTYVHDVSVQDGMAHAALIYAGDLRILDVSNPANITTISSEPSGAQFAHSTWPSEDNSIVVVADEKPALRHLSFYDFSNPNNPIKLSQFVEDTQSIPHNPFIKGDVCYVSWYTEGFIAIDISDPTDPVKIGRYDTQPNTGSGGVTGFNGAWGVYPYSPSGFVYVSDRSRGLFVLSFNECSVDLPSQPQPQICRVWPESVSALKSPRQRVVLQGKGFTNATEINVGGTVIDSSQFTRIGDQVLHFRMPIVSNPGTNLITVTNGAGPSSPMSVEVTLPEGPLPMLDTGDEVVSVGDKLTMAFASNPGDLMYPVAGFSPLPSEIFGTVSFDLGNAFNEFLWLAPNGMFANAAGVNGFTIDVPSAALGFTVYWQVAVVDPQVGPPATVTARTMTTVVD